MTRHEILSKIKQAEADAQASIERAQQERDKRIADALPKQRTLLEMLRLNRKIISKSVLPKPIRRLSPRSKRSSTKA